MSISEVSRLPKSGTRLLTVAIVIMTGVAGAAATSTGTARIAIAACVAVLAFAIAAGYPSARLCILVVWLTALGLTRRITTGIGTSFDLGDPLILVGAGLTVVLAAIAIRRGALRDRSPLTNSVLVLVGALALSVLNPLQGGIAVGLGGALLVVVPMLSFFVGRTLVDDSLLRRVLLIYAVLAVVVAAYGLFQTFAGFPAWDQRWIDQYGYSSLNVNGVVRSFSTFASSNEYSMFLTVGAMCWITLGWRSRLRLLTLPALTVILLALWYVSARGPVVMLIAALGLITAARFGFPIWRALLLTAVALAAMPWVLGQVAPSQFGSTGTSQLVEHQVSGLKNPFGSDSTLPGHLELTWEGIISAFRQPAGQGVGSVTIANTKLSEDKRSSTALSSTEQDAGNAALAAGVVGLVAYLCVVGFGLSRAYGRAQRSRGALALAALGALVATLLQWLTGGQYAVVILPWLVLGWLDRPDSVEGGPRSSSTRTNAAVTAPIGRRP